MKIKRLSLLLVLTMLVSLMAGVMPASAATGVDGAEKYEILTKLGFFDEKVEYAEKASVTRGEIITAIVNALPEERLVTVGDSTGFTDVSTTDAIAQIAATAASMKLLGDETELKANSIASLDDASFIILNLLGYNTVAKGNYASFAASIGLTKGVGSTTRMSVASLVSMLYNALDTELLQQVFTNGETTMKTIKGETLMTEMLKVRKLKGMITAGKHAAVLGEAPTNDDSVIINGTEYLVGSTGAADMLGMVIDFYFRVDEDDGHELLFVKLNDEKSVTEFEATRIRSYDPDTMTYRYETGEGTRIKTEEISRDTDIIYNGKNITGDFDSFEPADGYVRLIDNDGNGVNEIAVIMDYVSVTVGATDVTEGTITDIYDPTNVYKLALYDDELTYDIRDIKGVHGKFQDIDRYHTIFIAQSQDKELTTIITSDKYITGSVSALGEDEVIINNVAYTPSDSFLANTTAAIRSYGKFYLDPLGRVAYFETMGELGVKAGLVTKAIYDPDVDAVMLQMFTEDGKHEKLYTAEKLFVTRGNNYSAVIDENGKVTSYTAPPREKASDIDADGESENELVNVIKAYADSALNGMTFILYELNGKGEIKELEFPATNTDNIALSNRHDANSVFRKERTQSGQFKIGKIDYAFKQGADTKTFVIPSDITNKTGFHVYTGVVNAVRGWGESATTTSYKKNSNSAYSDYLIEYGSGGSGSVAEYPIFIVQDVLTTLNADDEIVKSVHGYWNGSEVTYELDEDLSEKDLGAGDIFRACVTDEGIITKIESHLDYSKKGYAISGNFGGIYGYYFGKLYDAVGTKLMVTTKEDPSEVSTLSDIGNCWGDEFTTVYKFDTETKEITTTSYGAAKAYTLHGGNASEVYMHFHYGDHREMVIYE